MKHLTIAAAAVTAVALVTNAVIHFQLAGPFDANAGTIVTQGGLFRIQAVIDILAAALIVVRPRVWTGLIAAVVAFGGLALILITVAVPLDLTFAGLPALFEPIWYQDKYISAAAQAVAVITAVIVIVRVRRAHKSA